ncbi:hypothetical protein [Foetidibacter luteolus]|uniref:hypothetical protein n=1 Tax=Foetidibacter luteolus TaxID=2608880 RepID=UPI00129BB736|nr:hypothetical protein [Foetidibacter luteolus]
MLSASSINKHSALFVLTLFVFSNLLAQENSPYSRYGIGEEYANQHVATKSYGGITTTYADGQAINVSNPASYGSIALVTYDLGFAIDRRTLRLANPVDKYTSTNFIPNYVILGIPLSRGKGWGMALGFRPVTRVNYSIVDTTQPPIGGTTRLQTLYEGNGGMNEFFWGLGKRFKNSLSIGFNVGVDFGRKQTNTRTAPVDSVYFYKGNRATTTTYRGLFLNGGLQYDIKLKKKEDKIKNTTSTLLMRVGAFGTLGNTLNAETDVLTETFEYDQSGGVRTIDTIEYQQAEDGKIKLPQTVRGGLSFIKKISDGFSTYDKWSVAVEYNKAQWSDYRFYGAKDELINNHMFRTGASLTPNNPFSDKSMFARSTYRVGFYTGKDFINADGNELKVFAFTAGFGFNIRKRRSFDNQFTLINTSFEWGKRGSNVNNITESFFRFSVGLSLSDVWFIKRKYE